LDTTRFDKYTVIPIINGFSDHDTQLLTISTNKTTKSIRKLKPIRKFDNLVITDFLNKLSNKTWATVFNNEDVNEISNSFLCDYLRIFNSSFPLQTVRLRKTLLIINGSLKE
jgi:hypothetical protein